MPAGAAQGAIVRSTRPARIGSLAWLPGQIADASRRLLCQATAPVRPPPGAPGSGPAAAPAQPPPALARPPPPRIPSAPAPAAACMRPWCVTALVYGAWHLPCPPAPPLPPRPYKHARGTDASPFSPSPPPPPPLPPTPPPRSVSPARPSLALCADPPCACSPPRCLSHGPPC